MLEPDRPAQRRRRPRADGLAGTPGVADGARAGAARRCAPATCTPGRRATATRSSCCPASSPAPSRPSSCAATCAASATGRTTGARAATSAPAPSWPTSSRTFCLELHDRYERKVSLVGWSAGGIYAREMARALPGHTRSVITLGSPFRGHPASTRAWTMYRIMNRRNLERMFTEEALAMRASPLRVPTTCIYSRTDGIVAWQCCVSEPAPQTENIEVHACHLGLRPRARDAARHRRPARPARGCLACRTPGRRPRSRRRRHGPEPHGTAV